MATKVIYLSEVNNREGNLSPFTPTPAQIATSLAAIQGGKRPVLYIDSFFTLRGGWSDFVAYKQLGYGLVPCVVVE